ncbi:DNA methylase [Mycobacterium phage Dorothy]|uniref:DNA methylase n=1 Tax=Mycobacterium phage Dorothy TaxID=2927992 RepID=J7KDR3_9CAUD|nr:methyltransferase [Mycobacterium phage Dorothy]AFQ97465.1 DNA methylase [Mycobacterium phage Dorothy]WAB10354.1 DNA methyltransferase [Mycobacterium phage RedBird]
MSDRNHPYYQDDQVTLYHGDALDVLAELPDRSVDAVVCDPPYGLEFMGKDWDAPWQESDVNADAGFHGGGISATRKLPSFTGTTNPKCLRCRGTRRGRRDGTAKVAVCLCRDGGQFPNIRAVEMRAFQQWCQEWASECLRVLKPGGHMLAFGGSRTWHRLASAIEDAGFEIRDSIAWLYGCLTADTEVLTDSGWKLGIDVTEGDLVAQWDSETDQITLAPVQQVFRAPWDGPMRILRNADTDQVLTPNHRVYHRPAQRKMVSGKRRRWFDNQWQVAEAADLSTWNPVQLPVAGHHEGSGIGGDDYAALLGWVWTEGGFDPSGTGVRIYQSSVNADKVAEIAALMDRIGAHKRYDRERTYRGRVYTETMWFISGELAERVRADLPGKRPTYDLLWRMTGSEKLALLRAAMLGDGSGWGTRSQQFHQKYEDDLVWLQTLLALIGRSGKVGMRPDRQCGALYLRDRATTELQARHLRDDTERYTGEVWCVKVPTGAFVARRNGKVFITGNSGFPKSLDVSKAIDKRPGVGRHAEFAAELKAARRTAGYTNSFDVAEKVTGRRTGAVANWEKYQWPEAQWWPALRDLLGMDAKWDGVIAEAQREVVGTRPHGRNSLMGGLEGRGTLAESPLTEASTEAARQWQGWGTALKPAFEPIVVARKPLVGTVAANVLEHGTGALNIDACRIGDGSESQGPRDSSEPSATRRYTSSGAVNIAATPGPRGGSPSGRWPTNVVLDDTQAAELDKQSGNLPGGVTVRRNMHGQEQNANGIYGSRKRYASEDFTYGDSGGASRFFPVFKYQAKAPAKERPGYVNEDGNKVAHNTVKPLDLMRWLVRLVTPPNGVVLDPFAGSGTTAEACIHEHKRCITIEREADYLPLIVARLSKPIEVGFDFGGAS